MERWKYPIDATEFVNHQERLAGRPLEDFERQYTREAAELINGAYEDGKAGMSTQFYPRDPEECWAEVVEQFHFSPPGSAGAKRFLTALCRLCSTAWEEGNASTKKEATA